jgi:hypothetical protein
MLSQGGANAIGQSPVPGMPGNQANPGAGIEQERQQAIAAIKSGKDAKKVKDIFRSRTGQEL